MASYAIVCLDDFEKYAQETMSKYIFNFFSRGADEEVTLGENRNAFKRYQIIPRVLRDVSKRETGTTILGYPISFPVCISPTAFHGDAHPDGEVGTARGAMSMKIGYTMSTYASRSIDEVADAAGDCLKFFQLHIFTRRDLVLRLVRWAERRDFKALVLTVDVPILGNRINYRRHQPMAGNTWRFGILDKARTTTEDRFDFDPSVTWDDVRWLKSETKLPLIVKGILNAEDAVLAVECGAAGILVSTHGGRQLDTIPASIDVLGDIVRAVDGRCEVYMDGGVRHGTDILKALALGARVVFIGRPAIYSLCYKGEEGVRQMLQMLKDEFSSSMALCGCTSVTDIKTTVVVMKKSLL